LRDAGSVDLGCPTAGAIYPVRVGGEREGSKPPAGLEAARFSIDGEELLVVSWPADLEPIAGLTEAEDAILRAALGGLTNAEIARQRRRSVFTVNNQLASALRKLGVMTRAEAAALLAKRRPHA
jgi:DNA-binding CsgD family transcriptional regulator